MAESELALPFFIDTPMEYVSPKLTAALRPFDIASADAGPPLVCWLWRDKQDFQQAQGKNAERLSLIVPCLFFCSFMTCHSSLVTDNCSIMYTDDAEKWSKYSV
jgi:hypothetical protein